MKDDEIRKAVRDTYAKIATGEKPRESLGSLDTAESAASDVSDTSCCAPQETASEASCCVPQQTASSGAPQQSADTASCCAPQNSTHFDYTAEQLGAIPEGADLGLGCGNPTALASLKEGEVVLDLGSGGGVDCFIAANRVGKKGKAIGVDMTPEMISRARQNAEEGGYTNVEFRLGEIENLPVADSSVDVIISNCVINLSPDKKRVFQEAYRVLKPGGRVMVSDIVLKEGLPAAIKNSVAAYVGCVAGASLKKDYLADVVSVGFQEVAVVSETSVNWKELADKVSSINVQAVKPS